MRWAIAGLALLGAVFIVWAGEAEAQVQATLSGGSTVLVKNGQHTSTTVSVSVQNGLSTAATGSVTVTSERLGSATASYDIPAAGGSASLSLSIPIDWRASEDAHSVSIQSCSARNATGSTKTCTGSGTANVQLVRPRAMELTWGGPTGEVNQGTTTTYLLYGRELYGWSSVTGLQPGTTRCVSRGGSGNVVSWGASPEIQSGVTIDAAPFGSGTAAPKQIGTVRIAVPDGLNAREFAWTQVHCSVTVISSLPSSPHQLNAPIAVDPIIPAWVELERASDAGTILFDRPIGTPGLAYTRPMVLTLRNYGEQSWPSGGAETARFTSVQASDVQVTTNAPIQLPASPFAQSREVEATLRLPPSHAETVVTAALQGTPFLRAWAPVAYRVQHDAALVLDLVDVNVGRVPIGKPVSPTLTPKITETLGYTQVQLVPRIRPADPALDFPLTVPTLLSVPPGGPAPVTITVNPPPQTPPGCSRTWIVTWEPHVATPLRPSLRPVEMRVTAFVELSNVEAALAEVQSLSLGDPLAVRALLAGVQGATGGPGCAAGGDVRAAGLAVQRLLSLSRAQADLATADPADLFLAAMELHAAEPRPGEPGHAALVTIEAKRQALRVALRQAVVEEARVWGDRSATGDNVDMLASLVYAIQTTGTTADAAQDPAVAEVKAITERELAELKEAYGAGREGLAYLMRSPSEVPRGTALASDVHMNANPLDWFDVGDRRARSARHHAAASAAFADLGPLGHTVAQARAANLAALSTGEASLVAGAAVDALIAIGLVFVGMRALAQYTRDLHDMGLGADVLD